MLDPIFTCPLANWIIITPKARMKAKPRLIRGSNGAKKPRVRAIPLPSLTSPIPSQSK